jgi:hypothetical protein
MSSTRGVTTCSKNAAQHPGLIVKTQRPRRTSKEVAAERQAKEDAKKEKALTKAANIKRIADYEIAQANKDALDATPKAIPGRRPLIRTRSYADVLAGNEIISDSDAETNDGGTNRDEAEETQTADSDASGDTEILSPPRKKKKVEEKQKEMAKVKAKAPKPKIRDAIKAAQVARLEEGKGPASDDGSLMDFDSDPTPKKTKASKLVVPASESDDDQESADLQQASWTRRMPTSSDNESTNAELTPQAHEGARGEAKVREKGKAKVKGDDKGKAKVKGDDKGKGKAGGKHDGKDKNNAPHQQPSDRKRVAPKLKR